MARCGRDGVPLRHRHRSSDAARRGGRATAGAGGLGRTPGRLPDGRRRRGVADGGVARLRHRLRARRPRRARPPAGPRPWGLQRPLPTGGGPRERPDHRVRGAVPLGRGRARGRLPFGVHPARRRTGTVGPIGRFVLREALRQGAEWRRDGCDVVMAVNVSAHQLSEPDLFSLVHATLRDTGLRPEGLCIEITETAIVRDRPTALGHVRALHDLGVTIALDDFGSGHASLAYLLDFPIDILKIDVAFVSTVDSDARSAALVSGIVQLAGHSAPRRSPRASSGPSSSTRCERWAATTARATSWADPGRRPPARRCARRTTRRRRSAPRGTDGAVDPLDRGGALGRAGRDRGQLRTRPCSASSLAICVPPTRPFSTWRPSGPPGMSSGAPSRRSLVACSRVRMS